MKKIPESTRLTLQTRDRSYETRITSYIKKQKIRKL